MQGQRSLLFVSVLAAACAGAPPRQAPGHIDVAAPQAEEAPILVPASAPKTLLVLGRMHDPRKWLRLEQTPPVLLERLGAALPDPGVLQLIDFEEPMEFALAWQPQEPDASNERVEEVCEEDCPPPAEEPSEFALALSLGLKSWDPSSLEQLGFARSGPLGYSRGNCAAQPALGGAPARLICSPSREQLRALEAYMARGLPLDELGSAPLALQLRPEPLLAAWNRERPGFERMLKAFLEHDTYFAPFTTFTPSPTLRVALVEAGKALLLEADALAHSIESATLEARPTPEDGLEIALTLAAKDTQSWLLRALVRANTEAGPPAQFERLHGMFSSAGFSWGVEPNDSAMVLGALRNVWPAGRMILETRFPRHQADAISSYVEAALSSRCLESGQDVWADAPYQPDRARPLRSRAERIRAALGHRLNGSPVEAKCGELLRTSLERLIASKDLRRSLAEIDPGLMLRKVRAPPSLAANTAVFQLLLPPALLDDRELLYHLEWITELFLFSLHDISLDVAGNPDDDERAATGKSAPLALTLVVQPTQNGDWIGLSAAPEQLYELMRPLAGAAPTTVKPTPELARLQAPRLFMADYFTLQDMVDREELQGLRELLTGAAGDAMRAPIVSTTRFQREQRGVKGRVDFYLPPPGVRALRQIATLDPALFAKLERELTPSLLSPLE